MIPGILKVIESGDTQEAMQTMRILNPGTHQRKMMKRVQKERTATAIGRILWTGLRETRWRENGLTRKQKNTERAPMKR
jgi:hypothetical protein